MMRELVGGAVMTVVVASVGVAPARADPCTVLAGDGQPPDLEFDPGEVIVRQTCSTTRRKLSIAVFGRAASPMATHLSSNGCVRVQIKRGPRWMDVERICRTHTNGSWESYDWTGEVDAPNQSVQLRIVAEQSTATDPAATGGVSVQPDFGMTATPTGPLFPVRTYVCIADEVIVSPQGLAADGAPAPDPCRAVGGRLTVDPDLASRVRADSDDWLVVRFGTSASSFVTPADVDFKKVVVSVGEQEIARKEAGTDGGEMVIVRLSALDAAPHGELATVRVYYGDRVDVRHFQVKNKLVLYGIGGTHGFWVPVGLFASNLDRGERGVAFTAFPVGLAFGGRHYFSTEFHLGVSVMANYALFPGDDAANGSDPDGAEFSLQGFSLGVLLDLNNYVFLGGSYGWDLREGNANPGALFVLGFGPQLLQALKSKL